jgi:hypothetical protein
MKSPAYYRKPELMIDKPGNAGTAYRVVLQKDMTFGVEVAVPGNFPAMVTSFPTEKKAEAWIAEHKRRLEEATGYKPWRKR